MPKSLPGKLALAMLCIGLLQVVVFVGMVYNNKGLGAIVNFLRFAPFTAFFGIVFGVVGCMREKKGDRMIPVSSILMAGLLLIVCLYFFFVWSFGG
ncbi:hypothetical protein [Bacillus sp. RAR_GA_16]|uniref:hypothetical protein n=1 Tax=Bacillus sp. RAR_GA_16 TaxID=2876774 RepID=UPI001CCD34E1|nr:hypothetical protein [Bacillus sp. RAR_GA_16]MCA0172638.1 hypothetical protein [Bacillus sp. RAR_GA_16]